MARREYLLTHQQLSKKADRGTDLKDNDFLFQIDFKKGRLDHYKNTYVAYQKGVLCGQSREISLCRNAADYYGASSLTVFKVPENINDLEKAVSEGIVPTTGKLAGMIKYHTLKI